LTRDIAAERKDIDGIVAGQTVPSLFQSAVRDHGDIDALKWKVGDEWSSLTWTQYGEKVRDFANGLLSLGLKPGQFVNIMGANRPEYYFADQGTNHVGGVPVSLYNTLAPEQIAYIVNHCEAAYVVLENRDYLERFLKIKAEIPNVGKVILIDDADEFADDGWIVSFEAVMEAGRSYGREHPAEFEQRWKAVTPEDLCTLIYTSGTTGPPKGVMVTHYNVCWTAESLFRMSDLGPGTTHISYLPLAHIAERMTGLYLHMKGGMTCHFCPDARKIGDYLRDVHPEFFFAVPRVWEKIYQGVNASIAGGDPEQRKTAEHAFDVGIEQVRLEQAGKEVPAELRKQVEEVQPVFDFIRQLVGLDKIRVVSTGAAPIAAEILEWYHALGVPVSEVYGQSEDTGPTSWNRPGEVKIGTVGPTIPGCEVKLLDDGELLVRGGNVTQGYYKDPELTAETFDAEGWLHSGDVAAIDEDEFISIVDRKKEIIITAGGKNIAPSNSENLLKQFPLIGQVAVIGDRRPYLVALIVLDAESLAAWAKGHGKPADVERLAKDPDVIAEVQGYIDKVNEQLHRQEQIKKFTILPKEWTAESEELTPTLKLKRKIVNQKYGDDIESMYA
jgi:long-chain acyl-CoA synthetase